VIVRNQIDMPYAYVVYDHTRARNVEVIRRWLNLQDIWLAGRYSEWEYYNSDHAFLAGRRVALEVADALSKGSAAAKLGRVALRNMPVGV
jgi:UDP-galactopyranose mutase